MLWLAVQAALGAEEEPDEEPCEEEQKNIFALDEEFDKNSLTMLIMLLIMVTVMYEQGLEYLESRVFTDHLSYLLLQKMSRELAILGFVSFTATVVMQFTHLGETEELFEYAHVLLFATAIMYVKEIAFVSRSVNAITNDFHHKDTLSDEKVLEQEKWLWTGEDGRRSSMGEDGEAGAVAGAKPSAAPAGVPPPVLELVERLLGRACVREWAERWRLQWRSSTFNQEAHEVISNTIFKVLRFHFMARAGLLGKKNFDWAKYLTRSMERQVDEMIEVTAVTWLILFLMVATSLPLEMQTHHALVGFAALAWGLLLLEVGLLLYSFSLLSDIIRQGHALRTACDDDGDGDDDDDTMRSSRVRRSSLSIARQSSGTKQPGRQPSAPDPARNLMSFREPSTTGLSSGSRSPSPNQPGRQPSISESGASYTPPPLITTAAAAADEVRRSAGSVEQAGAPKPSEPPLMTPRDAAGVAPTTSALQAAYFAAQHLVDMKETRVEKAHEGAEAMQKQVKGREGSTKLIASMLARAHELPHCSWALHALQGRGTTSAVVRVAELHAAITATKTPRLMAQVTRRMKHADPDADPDADPHAAEGGGGGSSSGGDEASSSNAGESAASNGGRRSETSTAPWHQPVGGRDSTRKARNSVAGKPAGRPRRRMSTAVAGNQIWFFVRLKAVALMAAAARARDRAVRWWREELAGDHEGHGTHGHDTARVHLGGLHLVPRALQLLLMAQCLLQALHATMLLRAALLELGVALGLLWSVVTLLPTVLMSRAVTPHVLGSFALASASASEQHAVLEEMETEAEVAGEYAAASQILELTATTKLSEFDLQSAAVVRAKAVDLIKLGEMRWRYRVVSEGDSPRDSAIEVLSHAKGIVEKHVALQGGARDGGRCRGLWWAELSDINMGLALARLIFNNDDRSEDSTISELLREALDLCESAGAQDKMATILNSLGTLKQKQKCMLDAEKYYTKSLELRRRMGSSQTAHRDRAQSYTSLGNLFVDMGDAAAKRAADGEGGEGGSGGGASAPASAEASATATEFYATALSHLQQAKEAYEIGFQPQHPKVAWALEGIGRVHFKRGSLRLAQAAWDEAIKIRTSLQEGASGKQMFSKELLNAQQRSEEVQALRDTHRKRLANPVKKLMTLHRWKVRPEASIDEDVRRSTLAEPLLGDDGGEEDEEEEEEVEGDDDDEGGQC